MKPTESRPPSAAKPDYGVDAPDLIRGFFAAATGCAIAALLVYRFWAGGLIVAVPGIALLLVGGVCLTLGSAMTAYVWRGKFRMRDFMLNKVVWRGDETVLDVGTGRGLLAIGAAKRLPSGRVIGLDIWNPVDLSDNRREAAEHNARLEGVPDRVTFVSEDARKMTFADGSFDVIVSLLCLHNIEPEAEQRVACREIARVLKPGGIALIADYVPTYNYAAAFAESGLTVIRTKPYFTVAYALMWMTEAVKKSEV